MTTANALCIEALKTSGLVALGQTAEAEEISRAFSAMNGILALWQRRRWLIWRIREYSKAATAGTQTAGFMTVGAASDFVIDPRPDRIEGAYLRQTVPSQPNQVDYPLEEIKSWEDWSRIALKSLVSFPSYFFYDSAFPVAKIYFYPVPQASLYTLFIGVKETLGQITNINAQLALPLEYEAALHFNLARRLRVMYRKPPDPSLDALARDATNVIRMANVQIARLTMPNDMVRPGIYNIFSDQMR